MLPLPPCIRWSQKPSHQRLLLEYVKTIFDLSNLYSSLATQNAGKTIFSGIIVINCFLHIYIKIRDRAKKKYKDHFFQATKKAMGLLPKSNERDFRSTCKEASRLSNQRNCFQSYRRSDLKITQKPCNFFMCI